MRNPFVREITQYLGPLALCGAAYIIIINYIDPSATTLDLVGRIANIALPGFGMYVITRLVIGSWGKTFMLLVTPTALMFYTFVFILIVNRKDQLDLPGDLLFSLTVGVGLMYGLLVAAVKFKDAPSVFRSWQLFQRFISTIGIGSIIGYGALRITDDFIRHVSLGFEQLPFLLIGIPVIFAAQLELTYREIQRPYTPQNIENAARVD